MMNVDTVRFRCHVWAHCLNESAVRLYPKAIGGHCPPYKATKSSCECALWLAGACPRSLFFSQISIKSKPNQHSLEELRIRWPLPTAQGSVPQSTDSRVDSPSQS